jgi:hypothetical protein
MKDPADILTLGANMLLTDSSGAEIAAKRG